MSSANFAGYDPIQTSIRQIIGYNKGTTTRKINHFLA